MEVEEEVVTEKAKWHEWKVRQWLLDNLDNTGWGARDSLLKARDLRDKGTIEPLDPSEINAEDPGIEFVLREFPAEEVKEGKGSFKEALNWAGEHKKEIAVVSTVAGGMTTVIIGGALTIKHFLDKRREAEATDVGEEETIENMEESSDKS